MVKRIGFTIDFGSPIAIKCLELRELNSPLTLSSIVVDNNFLRSLKEDFSLIVHTPRDRLNVNCSQEVMDVSHFINKDWSSRLFDIRERDAKVEMREDIEKVQLSKKVRVD